MGVIEFAGADAFLEPTRLCLAVLFGRIIPAAVLTAQRRRLDSRIRQDDAGTVAPGQSGDVAARVA